MFIWIGVFKYKIFCEDEYNCIEIVDLFLKMVLCVYLWRVEGSVKTNIYSMEVDFLKVRFE